VIDDIAGLSFPLVEYTKNGNTFIAVITAAENPAYFERFDLSTDNNPVLYFIQTKQ
jgi:hypothetical protein